MKVSLSGKNKYLDKLLSDSQFRLFLAAAFCGGWNFVYAIFNMVLSGLYRSVWFLTLGIYYFALGCMRGALVVHGKSSKDKRKPESVVKHIGLGFFLIAVLFSGTVALSIVENHSTGYNTIIMITIATYTFYQLVMAIVNIFKARKSLDIKVIAIRNITLGGVVVSMFSLEKSMMITFGEYATRFIFLMQAISGAGIFAIIVALGINLIRISTARTYR